MRHSIERPDEDEPETKPLLDVTNTPIALDDASAEVERMVASLARVGGGRIEGATRAETRRVRELARAVLDPLTRLHGQLLSQRARRAGKVVTA